MSFIPIDEFEAPSLAIAKAARVPEHYDSRELPRAGVLLIGMMPWVEQPG